MDSTVNMCHNSKTYDSDIHDRRYSQIDHVVTVFVITTHIQSLLLFLTVTTQFQPLSPIFKQRLLFLWWTTRFQCSAPVLTVDACFWQIACVFDHIWLLGTAFNCFHSCIVSPQNTISAILQLFSTILICFSFHSIHFRPKHSFPTAFNCFQLNLPSASQNRHFFATQAHIHL